MKALRFIKSTRAPDGVFYGAGEIAGFGDEAANILVLGGYALPLTDQDRLPIPDDWRDLGAEDAKDLATRIAGSSVKTKAAAIAVIEAEIDRRAGVLPPPADEAKGEVQGDAGKGEAEGGTGDQTQSAGVDQPAIEGAGGA
jgi:hypothetical protein